MEVFLLIGIFILLFFNGFVVWFLIRGRDHSTDGQGFGLILQQMNELNKTMDSKMYETNRAVQSHFQDSQRLIQDINKQVNEQLRDVVKGQSEVAERSNRIFAVAEQLQDLQRTLKSQKERGNFGEASLRLILSNILPPEVYEMEYGFSDGTRVDAVIHTPEGIIPIDAKFSLESYAELAKEVDDKKKKSLEKKFRDDLKNRIDETAKYIKPNEGTLPFAFMYIPAEGIYYELLVKQVSKGTSNSRNMVNYAINDKKVIIVSPTTFYAYLQSVLYGFRAFKIEKNTESIKKNVTKLSRHFNRYNEFFKKMGCSLKTVVGHYNNADKELGKIDRDMEKITGESMGVEVTGLEEPETREEDEE